MKVTTNICIKILTAITDAHIRQCFLFLTIYMYSVRVRYNRLSTHLTLVTVHYHAGKSYVPYCITLHLKTKWMKSTRNNSTFYSILSALWCAQGVGRGEECHEIYLPYRCFNGRLTMTDTNLHLREQSVRFARSHR